MGRRDGRRLDLPGLVISLGLFAVGIALVGLSVLLVVLSGGDLLSPAGGRRWGWVQTLVFVVLFSAIGLLCITSAVLVGWDLTSKLWKRRQVDQ